MSPAARGPCIPPTLDSMLLVHQRFMEEGRGDLKKSKLFNNCIEYRHYLLGRPFTILTDHAPLQWLSGQKMEGLLCRWALALQEYDFIIQYRKGSQNSNADALSRCHPQTEK